jgi:cytochrome P450
MTALPVQTMARLLGVAPPQLAATSRWVHQFTQGIAAGAPEQAVALASEAAAALMTQGEAEGLSSVAAANRIALMQQSLDATAGLLGNTVCLLQDRPALAADASGLELRSLVAEVARWDAPVQNTRRFAAEDLELAGRRIAQGEGVLLLLASANRDPAFNERPDAFEVHREHRRSLTFGAGAHACPGADIAIEIVAECARHMRAEGRLASFFGRRAGFRPLSNARIPIFAR